MAILNAQLPFPEPHNSLEAECNEQARKFHDDPDMRNKNQYVTAYAVHPTEPGVAYKVSYGWTHAGWRVFAVAQNEREFANDMDTLAYFAETFALTQAIRGTLAQFGTTAQELLDRVTGKLEADGNLTDGTCGDPDCPVHGDNHSPIIAVLKDEVRREAEHGPMPVQNDSPRELLRKLFAQAGGAVIFDEEFGDYPESGDPEENATYDLL